MTNPSACTLYGTKQHTPLTSTPEGSELAVFYSGFSSALELSHIHANRSVVVVVIVIVVVIIIIIMIVTFILVIFYILLQTLYIIEFSRIIVNLFVFKFLGNFIPVPRVLSKNVSQMTSTVSQPFLNFYLKYLFVSRFDNFPNG